LFFENELAVLFAFLRPQDAREFMFE